MKFKAKRMSVQVGWSGLLNEPEAPAGPFAWTPIPIEHPDDHQYYVDSVAGLDPTDPGGLTWAAGGGRIGTPWKTFTFALTQLRSTFGDRIYLKCGGSFTGNMFAFHKTGLSSARPMLITSYGTGARPIIDIGSAAVLYQPDYGGGGWREDHMWFVGLEIWSSTYNGSTTQKGFYFLWANTDQLVEDCYIHNVTLGIDAEGLSIGRLSAVSIRGNTISDCYSENTINSNPGAHGSYAADIDGVTYENNLFINTGWRDSVATYASTFKHALYVHAGGTGTGGGGCTDVTVKDNLIVYGDGITCRPGGTVTGNVCVRSLSGVQVGMGDTAQVGGITVTLDDNVAIELKALPNGVFSGSGIIGFAMGNISGASSFANNICANALTDPTVTTGRAFWFRTPDNLLATTQLVVGAALDFRNNILYRSGTFAGQERPDSSYTALTTFTGNDFQLTEDEFQNESFYLRSNNMATTLTDWSGNNFYSTAAAPQWFLTTTGGGAGNFAYAAWVSLIGDVTATSVAPTYTDPTRNLGDWYLSVGGTDDTDAAVAYLKTRSKASNWVSVVDIAAYLRAGFGR